MQNRPSLFIGMVLIAALASGVFIFWDKASDEGSGSKGAYTNPIISQALKAPYVETQAAKKPKDPPTTYKFNVPFTSQAPHANWDLPYQEACEEAAALMAHYYWTNQTFTKTRADQEILALVDFQIEHYGAYKDTTLTETKRFMEDYWGHHNLEIYKADNQVKTLEKIKAVISKNIPVIVPTAGRELHNPNFTPPGPVYHYLVIRGYMEGDKIITNDPGTKNGEAYVYNWDVLYDAIHDWNGGAVASGAKVILIANR